MEVLCKKLGSKVHDRRSPGQAWTVPSHACSMHMLNKFDLHLTSVSGFSSRQPECRGKGGGSHHYQGRSYRGFGGVRTNPLRAGKGPQKSVFPSFFF